MAMMFVIMKLDYHVYRKPAVVFSVLVGRCRAAVCCVLPAAQANTHRWIQLPGFSFQPSELAKLALIFFLAYFLEKRKGRINDVQLRWFRSAVIVALLAGSDCPSAGSRNRVWLAGDAAVLLYVAGLEHAMDWRLGACCCRSYSRFTFLFSACRTAGTAFWRSGIPRHDPLGNGFQIIQS